MSKKTSFFFHYNKIKVPKNFGRLNNSIFRSNYHLNSSLINSDIKTKVAKISRVNYNDFLNKTIGYLGKEIVEDKKLTENILHNLLGNVKTYNKNNKFFSENKDINNGFSKIQIMSGMLDMIIKANKYI